MSYQDDNNGYDRFDGFVVRIRGLPWSASQDEVANFLSGMCNSFMILYGHGYLLVLVIGIVFLAYKWNMLFYLLQIVM